MTDHLEPLAVFEVNPDGSTKEHYTNVDQPGLYAIVRFADIDKQSVVEPVRRVFHLGELGGWLPADRKSLAKCGLRTNLDAARAGRRFLETNLPKTTYDKLIAAFGRLGVHIGEVCNTRKPTRSEAALILTEYAAYSVVSRTREKLAKDHAEDKESVFVSHAAGYDVVCGSCGAQQLAVPDRDVPGLVCRKCGTHLGKDFKSKTRKSQQVLVP